MLDSLQIRNFRCFEDLKIESLGRVNLIVGKNSVGKTTLLEAIYFFSNHGRPRAVENILRNRGEALIDSNESKFKISYYHTNPKGLLSGLADTFVGSIDNTIGYSFPAQEKDDRGILKDWQIAMKARQEKYNHSSITSQMDSEELLAENWDQLLLDSEEEEVLKTLRIIHPDLLRVAFIDSRETEHRQRVAIAKFTGDSKAVPLRSLGEGMVRLLQIFTNAMQAKGGYLLIDEFENGLHYSIQEEVWNKVFKLAKELDIQVFATTHSQDTVRAFSKIALESLEEGRLISLGRNEWDKENSKISALVYNEDEIRVISETGMDVR